MGAVMEIDSESIAKATAGGEDENEDDADAQADAKTNNNPNNGGDKTLPKAEDETDDANTETNDKASTDSSGVGVAAAISVNVVTAVSEATISDNVTVAATGDVTVESSADVDSTSKATGEATTIDDSNNVGAAVAVNRGDVNNRALIGNNANVLGSEIRVAAITTGAETHDMMAWADAAASGSGDFGIAGSVGVNVVDVTTDALLQPGSQVTATNSLDVIAESAVNPQTLAGALGVSSGTSVGGAVAVTVMDLDTQAIVDGNADASGVMTIDASATVRPTKFDIQDLSPADDPIATSVALGGGVSSGDVGVAGAVVVSVYNVDTTAKISDGSMINQIGFVPLPTQTVNVLATTDLETFSLAGSLGASLGATGVGRWLGLRRLQSEHTRVDL